MQEGSENEMSVSVGEGAEPEVRNSLLGTLKNM
jgi:hypothetical protein